MVKKFIRNPAEISRKSSIASITKANTIAKLESPKKTIRGNNRAVPLVKGKLNNPRAGNFGSKRIGGGNVG